MTTHSDIDEENGQTGEIEKVSNLDEKGVGFTSIWKQWKSRPLIKLGEGWFFKFCLWCFRC